MQKKREDKELAEGYRSFITRGLLSVYALNNRSNPRSANLALGNWAIKAQKQKLFCKGLAENIDLIVKLHKARKGNSGLLKMFEQHYLENKTTAICFKTFSGREEERIKAAIKSLKINNWVTNFPVKHDPVVNGRYEPIAEKEAFVLEEDWQSSINSNGTMAKPLRVYSTEVLQELVDAFYSYGFYIVLVNKDQSDDRTMKLKWYYSFDIYPHDEPKSGVEIPSIHNK